MKTIKKLVLELGFGLVAFTSIAQNVDSTIENQTLNSDSCQISDKAINYSKNEIILFEQLKMEYKPLIEANLVNSTNQYKPFRFQPILFNDSKNVDFGLSILSRTSGSLEYKPKMNFEMNFTEDNSFSRNRRNIYSSVWAFASLNYIYADLVGLMDKNKLNQYQTGVVEGVKITPKFLTIAGAFMQIPIANVILPHLIKKEKTLRWVQIASGTIMTLVQSGTLFVGKPSPYYSLFSAFEIAATTFITIDAIRWKVNKSKKQNNSL